jgi:hypothetical protein
MFCYKSEIFYNIEQSISDFLKIPDKGW